MSLFERQLAPKSERSSDTDHDGALHGSNSANLGELAPRATIVELGRKPFSVLTINSGSSSLRLKVFPSDQSLPQVLSGKFACIGLPGARLCSQKVVIDGGLNLIPWNN